MLLPLQEKLLQVSLFWTFSSSVFRAWDWLWTDTDIVTNRVLPPLLCQHELCTVYQTETHLPIFIPDIHCITKCISNNFFLKLRFLSCIFELQHRGRSRIHRPVKPLSKLIPNAVGNARRDVTNWSTRHFNAMRQDEDFELFLVVLYYYFL